MRASFCTTRHIHKSVYITPVQDAQEGPMRLWRRPRRRQRMVSPPFSHSQARLYQSRCQLITTCRSRINTAGLGNSSPADATDVSRGIFGATAGLDRVLSMFKKYGIQATFFTPGHSVESFKGQVLKVRDAGHELYVSLTSKHPTFFYSYG